MRRAQEGMAERISERKGGTAVVYWRIEMHFLAALFLETWRLFFEMAPYLLLGFVLSGALYVYLPKERLMRHLGRPGLGSVVKAALFGIPLPLCSCGAIPAALALRKQGATRGATLAFLISTPQTGADSILATYKFMGGFLALMRPVFSMLTAVVTGILANAFDPEPAVPHAHSEEPGPTESPLFRTPRRFRRIVSYGLRDHLAGIYRWLLVGLFLAALVSHFMPKPCHGEALPFQTLGVWTADKIGAGYALRGFLVGHNELLCMLLMVALGVPLYICATGSIPLAMSFVQAGLSPGAAFVFLMTGPATNVTTIVMAWRYLGRRTTVIYLCGIVGIGLLSGYAINELAPHHGLLSLPAPTIGVHEHGTASLVAWACALVLGGAIAAAAWIDLGMLWRARMGGEGNAPRTLTLPVDGMTCGHCMATVEAALRGIPGVARAEANVSANRVQVTLEAQGPPLERIRAAIEQAGYRVPGSLPPGPAA